MNKYMRILSLLGFITISFWQSKDPLVLALFIAKDYVTIGARGGFLPNLEYKYKPELDKHVAFIGGTKDSVFYYNKQGKLLLTAQSNPISRIRKGDTVCYYSGKDISKEIVIDLSQYHLHELELSDELNNRFNNTICTYKAEISLDTLFVGIKGNVNPKSIKYVLSCAKNIGFKVFAVSYYDNADATVNSAWELINRSTNTENILKSSDSIEHLLGNKTPFIIKNKDNL